MNFPQTTSATAGNEKVLGSQRILVLIVHVHLPDTVLLFALTFQIGRETVELTGTLFAGMQLYHSLVTGHFLPQFTHLHLT